MIPYINGTPDSVNFFKNRQDMVQKKTVSKELSDTFGIELTADELNQPRYATLVRRLQNLWSDVDDVITQIDQEKAKVVLRIPKEPAVTSIGSLENRYITFFKSYRGIKKYHYAAISPAGKTGWTITGRHTLGTNVSWSSLVDFIKLDEAEPQTALNSVISLTPNRYLTPSP